MKKALIAAILMFGGMTQAFAVGSVADVTVYDRVENRTLPVYYHDGRYYVVGKPGNEYQVNVRNRQPGEVLAVISVDGVNAVSGEAANWSQTGYVLSPYRNLVARGVIPDAPRIARPSPFPGQFVPDPR